MNKLVVLAGAILFATTAMAQETENSNESLGKAPEEVIQSATEACQSWAKEDQVKEDEMSEYMGTCINDELQAQGYQPATSS